MRGRGSVPTSRLAVLVLLAEVEFIRAITGRGARPGEPEAQ